MPLTESRRRQLDSIVSSMESNKESEDDIRFVVRDFQSKYESEQPPPPRGASGTWEEDRITDAEADNTSMMDALFPRRAQAERENAGLGRGLAARAADVGSNIFGVPYAAVETLAGNDEQRSELFGGRGSFKKNLMNRSEGSLIKRIANDPAAPTMLINPVGGGIRGAAVAGLKQGAASAAGHQIDRIGSGEGIDLKNAAAEVTLSTALPAFVGGAAKGIRSLGHGSKNAVSRLSDIPEEALAEGADPTRLQEFMNIARKTGGDQTKLADDVLGKFGEIRKADDEAMEFVNAKRQGALQSQLLDARRGKGSLEDVSAFDAGKRIEDASQGAMAKAGEKFQAGQDQVLRDTGAEGKKLLWGFRGGKNQNALASAVDDYMQEINYNPELGYGVVGNRVIPKGAINEIQTLKKTYEKARTTRDVLDMLRLTDQRIDFGGPENGRLFAPGSDEDWAIKNFRNKFGEIIEGQIRRSVPADRADEFADLWHAHRASYSNTRKAIETIQDGLGAGRANTESYFAKIKEIGIEDLRRIRTMAINDPDMRPVFEELQNGFFDNLLKKGMKDGGLEYNAFSKAWGSVDDDLKAVMLPQKVRSRVDEVLQRTKPIEFEPTQLGREVAGAGMSQQSAVRSIENIGTKDKRSALQELELLDDLLGLQGKSRFSTQAMDAFRAKQLQITPEGRLPMMSNARTGKSIAGLSYGEIAGGGVGTAVGAMSGGFLGAGAGAVLGKYAGQLAGAYAQSPAGALAAYRLLLQLEKPVAAGVRAVERSVPRTTGALRSGLFQPEYER